MKAFCLVASVVACGQLCLAESSTVTFSSSSSSADGFFSSATSSKNLGKDSAALETVAKPRVIMTSFESFAKVSDGAVTIAGIKFKLSYGSNSMTMFSDDDKAEQQLKVEFSDPEGVIVDLKVLVGGKPLSQSGSSMMNAKKSYFFNKPTDEVTLVVTYAQGVKTLTLPL